MNPATDKLKLKLIRLGGSQVVVDDDFLPSKMAERVRYELQPPCCRRQLSATVRSDSGAVTEKRYIFHVETGARFFVVPDGDNNDDAESQPFSVIKATFIAEYALKDAEVDDVSVEERDDFGVNNATFHVYPYWREYVDSVCSRLWLPRLTIPMYAMRESKRVDESKQ